MVHDGNDAIENPNIQNDELKEYVDCMILDIGDGIIGDENDGYATVQIPAHMLIAEYNDPINAIVKSTFSNLYQHYNNPQFFKFRAILASTNETVEQ
ncbi:hypothetical protein JHK82_044789 [Glycine max]|nr:hypothetical protein JHK82_044789 [Glycine max]